MDLESAEQGAGSLAFRGLPLLAMPVPQGGDEARPVQLSMAEFLALKSTPKDAPLYAQGYLVERQTLQPQRPPLPGDEDLQQFCWDYHQGRLLTWNIAGNDSRLPPGAQPGIKDRRAVTTEDPAGRPGPPSSKPA